MTRHRALIFTVATAAAAALLVGCAGGTAEPESSATADQYGLVTPGTLTVATEGTYRPFTYHEDGSGELVGYDVEIIEAVADKLGL